MHILMGTFILQCISKNSLDSFRQSKHESLPLATSSATSFSPENTFQSLLHLPVHIIRVVIVPPFVLVLLLLLVLNGFFSLPFCSHFHLAPKMLAGNFPPLS